ncbi:MAG: hypothetical protein ACRDFS_05975 [Chloroflexota bacterium]
MRANRGDWWVGGCSLIARGMQVAEDDDGEPPSSLLVAGTFDSWAACRPSFALSMKHVGVAVT